MDKMTRAEFVEYLTETVIPELREAQIPYRLERLKSTADDFETAVRHLRSLCRWWALAETRLS